MTNKKPKSIYGNGVNFAGLMYDQPLQFNWNSKTQSWWGDGDHVEIRNTGLEVKDWEGDILCVMFSSPKEEDVRIWTDGAKAAMAILRAWAGENREDKIWWS